MRIKYMYFRNRNTKIGDIIYVLLMMNKVNINYYKLRFKHNNIIIGDDIKIFNVSQEYEFKLTVNFNY